MIRWTDDETGRRYRLSWWAVAVLALLAASSVALGLGSGLWVPLVGLLTLAMLGWVRSWR